jgi:hypothetical protein
MSLVMNENPNLSKAGHASATNLMTTPQTMMSVAVATAATEYSNSLSAEKNDLGNALPPGFERIVYPAQAVCLADDGSAIILEIENV